MRTAGRSTPFRRAAGLARPVAALVLIATLPSCAVLPLAALGTFALETGGGALVKTGTEYSKSGAAHRTFIVSIDDVHAAVLEAFRRADLSVKRIETSPRGQQIRAEAEHRKLRVRLTRLTRVMTAMELIVKRNFLASDRATASELLAQVEAVLAERRLLAMEVEANPTSTPVPSATRTPSRSRARR